MAKKKAIKQCKICRGPIHGYGPDKKYGSPIEEAAYLAACDALGQGS